jgi:organic hydroperoxide reductase OsmC/OhrA
MRVEVTGARAKVRAWFQREGAILNNTIRSSCTRVEIELRIDSPADRSRVAMLIRNAEQSCYVAQAIRQPAELVLLPFVNGEEFEVDIT